MNYKQLSLSERNLIYLYLRNGESIRSIAKHLLRSPSTISREIKRMNEYNPEEANNRYIFNKQNANIPNLSKYSVFIEFFIDNFDKRKYSPDVLVGVARKRGIQTTCTKTLYSWINLGLLKIKNEIGKCTMFENKSNIYLYQQIYHLSLWSLIMDLNSMNVENWKTTT